MAIQVVFKVEADREYLNVFDETGAYSSSNQGGWGLPNIQISDVVSAVVNVYFPSQDNFIPKDVSMALPNIDGIGFQLTASMFNKTDFPPGVYRFDLVYTTSTEVISSSIRFYHYRPLECCISQKKMKLQISDVSSSSAIEVLELEALLENSIWAACSGNIYNAQEISEYISSKCDCCGC